jgi:hypothetical protein
MFPTYLKYKQHQTYFKINSSNNFEELRIVGNFFSLTVHEASILPDRVFIADLLYDKGERLEKLATQEFNEVLADCYKTKIEKFF